MIDWIEQNADVEIFFRAFDKSKKVVLVTDAHHLQMCSIAQSLESKPNRVAFTLYILQTGDCKNGVCQTDNIYRRQKRCSTHLVSNLVVSMRLWLSMNL